MYNLETMEKTLPNGLQVLLIRKKDFAQSLFLLGAPCGGLNIVEAKNGERFVNPSGCAHFLEHQMFRLNGKDVTGQLAALGASTNAGTSYTETVYYFSTTGDPIPPLKILIDFVQTLDITEESMDKEKGIILSEYYMYDRQPESALFKELFRSLYHTHGLRIDILGTPEDIENMTVENLRTFYEANYDPSRLVLIGITGHELAPIMEAIEKQEAAYPSINHSAPVRVLEEDHSTVERAFFETRMDITVPMAAIGFKLDPVEDIEESLKDDLIVSLWLDSIFTSMNPDYQTWLDEHLITAMAGAEEDFTEDHAYVLFYAQTEKPEAFFELVRELVKKPRTIDPEAFRALKIQYLARSLRMLDQFESLGMDVIHSRFDHYDYEKSQEMVRTLSLEECEQFLNRLDFDREAAVIVRPRTEA